MFTEDEGKIGFLATNIIVHGRVLHIICYIIVGCDASLEF